MVVAALEAAEGGVTVRVKCRAHATKRVVHLCVCAHLSIVCTAVYTVSFNTFEKYISKNTLQKHILKTQKNSFKKTH